MNGQSLKGMLAGTFAFVLRTLPTHKLRKKYAKFFGPFFVGAVAKTAYGFWMVCNWYDNVNRAVFEGSFGAVEDFILRLPANATFIDIGANQGGTALLAAKTMRLQESRGGGRGRVLAYEPNPVAGKSLRQNIALNDYENIAVFEMGVSPERKRLNLDVSDVENSGAAHISEVGSPVEMGPISMRDVKLDGGGRSPIFVKIDTEGYEMEVLRGIEELLASKQVEGLVIEIDEANLGRYGSSAQEVYDFLASSGFAPLYGPSSGHYDEVFVASF